MQHRYFGKYASYYLFSVAYHKIPLAQLTLLASRINAPQQQVWDAHLGGTRQPFEVGFGYALPERGTQ